MNLLLLLLACAGPESGGPDHTTEPCPDGFSGDDCAFCTFESAGQACEPGQSADLFDIDAIKALSLDDLGWTVIETQESDDGTVVIGEIETPFAGVTAEGEDMDVTMTSQVAVYVPADWPSDISDAARGKAFVSAAHFAGSVESAVGSSIARATGMPVLFHGEKQGNFTQLGYESKGEIELASWGHMYDRNTCDSNDWQRGFYIRYLAEVDMRVITLAQRLAEQAGETLDEFALRGYSKEGRAIWLAMATDDRIAVGSPGGSPFQDYRAYLENTIEQLGCEGDPETEETAHAAVNNLAWATETPAGAAFLNRTDTTLNQVHFKQRFILTDGDNYMPGTHDGSNFLLGVEDVFFDALTAVPWRYSRKSGSGGTFGDDGDTVSTTLVPYLVAEALVRDDDPADWYPKVDVAEASLGDGVLSVGAEVSGDPETVVLWASYSDDRSWSEEGQASWTEFVLESDGAGWSTEVDLDALGIADKVIGWYVEGRNTLSLGGAEYARKDASPVRFFQEPDMGGCVDVEPLDHCAQE